MKKIGLIFTFISSILLFSLPASAEWSKVSSDKVKGYDYYVDFDRIKKSGNYIYFWELWNFKNPVTKALGFTDIFRSAKMYTQGDCSIFRKKFLKVQMHSNKMGIGVPAVIEGDEKEWSYPNPETISEQILKSACRQLKGK